MRTLQEIFNHVIANKFYTNGATDYMCNSLFLATMGGILTRDERDFALAEIDAYLNSLKPDADSPLYSTMLEAAYNGDSPTDTVEHQRIRRLVDQVQGRHGIVMGIYKDWENRPKDIDAIHNLFNSVINTNDE